MNYCGGAFVVAWQRPRTEPHTPHTHTYTHTHTHTHTTARPLCSGEDYCKNRRTQNSENRNAKDWRSERKVKFAGSKRNAPKTATVVRKQTGSNPNFDVKKPGMCLKSWAHPFRHNYPRCLKFCHVPPVGSGPANPSKLCCCPALEQGIDRRQNGTKPRI